MTLDVISFTKNGIELANKIAEAYEDCRIFTRYEGAKEDASYYQGSIQEFAKAAFLEKHALLFISSTGIAVRAIASCVEDKLTDSPVLVCDEAGTYMISLLSGHVGGANELATVLAAAIGACPVITTATDRNEAFSVDLFAKENNLSIGNRDAIKRVSTKALEGKPICISIEGYPPKDADVVVSSSGEIIGESIISLCPKKYAVGMGCKRDKSFEEIESLFLKVIKDNQISIDEVGCISSIDIKANEPGLMALSKKYQLPLLTFSAEVLKTVEGNFHSSEFVESQVGVDNVCERAALAAVGYGGLLLVNKTAENGVTIALAKRR